MSHCSSLWQRTGNSEILTLTQTRESKKLNLSNKIAPFLACVSEKPLKNTKRRKLEKFPLPVECDNSYPLKLDAMSRSLSRFREERGQATEQAAAVLEALLSLQEQPSQDRETDPIMLSSAIKTAISLHGNVVAHFNLGSRKSIIKHLNKENHPFIFQTRVVLKPLVSLIGCLVACSARISVDTHTHTHTDKQTIYCNPRMHAEGLIRHDR